MSSSFVSLIPFTTPHGGIVIGQKASNIQKLQREYGCKIETKSADPEHKRENPYFLVRAPNEQALNHVCLEIQRLLIISMMRGEKKAIEAHGVKIAEKDREISELEEELDRQQLLNREMLEDQRANFLEEHRLEMLRNDEESDEDSDDDGITMGKHN